MAQTGFTPIQLYSTSTAAAVPSAGNLTNSTLGSELAINITDGKLFYKDNANVVQVIGWKVVPPTAGGTGTTTAFTAGSVVFAGASGIYDQNNANLFWDNANTRLGIGTNSPISGYSLSTQTPVFINNQNTDITPDNNWSGQLTISGNGYKGGFAADATGLWVGHNSSNRAVIFATNETERARITGAGDVGVNGTPTAGVSGQIERFQQLGTDGASSSLGIKRYSADSGSPNLRFYKSRGATIGTNTVVVDGDGLANIDGYGYDGAAYTQAARIGFFVDGTPGSGDMPGRITFSTTSDGASTITERLRIASSGLVSLENSAGLVIARTSVTSPASTDGNVFSGTYTPTLFNTTNVAASTASACQYMRVGNVVTVSGLVEIDPTAANTDTILGMSIPVASNFGGSGNAGGTFVEQSSQIDVYGCIYADTANDRLSFRCYPVDASNRNYHFTVTYRII